MERFMNELGTAMGLALNALQLIDYGVRGVSWWDGLEPPDKRRYRDNAGEILKELAFIVTILAVGMIFVRVR